MAKEKFDILIFIKFFYEYYFVLGKILVLKLMVILRELSESTFCFLLFIKFLEVRYFFSLLIIWDMFGCFWEEGFVYDIVNLRVFYIEVES